MTGILDGLKVIDAASFLAAPCATTIMSDYGADVIKVEPLSGDRHRTLSGGHPIDHSWQLTGRGKRSLALNIATDAGRDVLLTLVREADVIVFNFRTEQLAKYRLTFEDLHAENPQLIVGQVTGYGALGPDANKPAFDVTGWYARSGILDMMHDKGIAPAPPAGGVGDHATAMTLFGGLMLALRKRDATGLGSMVQTSLAATGTWANGLNLQAVIAGVDTAARRDIEGWSNPLANVYTTSDERYIALAVQNMRRDWPALATVVGHEEWLDDERFASVKTLFRHRLEVKEMLKHAFAQMTLAQASAALTDAGIVHAIVERNGDVVNDEQLIANGVVVPTTSDEPGYDRTLATPLNISDAPQRVPERAPGIGAHSLEVLREFGYSDEQIDGLREAGVVGSWTVNPMNPKQS